MHATSSPATLRGENRRYLGSGARSPENRAAGFRPAFRDSETGRVYESRFGDGSPAPCHLLDGLPEDLVLARDDGGRVRRVKPSLESGFLRECRFFTRDEAAAWMRESAVH